MSDSRQRRWLLQAGLATASAAAFAGWLGAQCGGDSISTAPRDGGAGAGDTSAPGGSAGGEVVADAGRARDAGSDGMLAAAFEDYDPLATAAASRGHVANREAVIPPQCYTKTEGSFNPCWTCHTESRFPNLMSDWSLQREYAFSEQGQTNHWSNLFVDRAAAAAAITDDAIVRYIREDNYAPLRASLALRSGYAGYRPDLDFARGFDEAGFAKDGSAWRAFRYKPFPGVFWPTNGASDDVMIRLAPSFRQAKGKPNREVYKANLAILEASFASDPEVPAESLTWPTEPIDEKKVGVDLDDDGRLQVARQLVGLPKTYVGDAGKVLVQRSQYPQGTEFLHSVRYLDPDAPNFISTRMKELRYSRKMYDVERWKIISNYQRETDEREEGKPAVVQGDPLTGMVNEFGWRLQGFIEDAKGRLRVQTEEEQVFCMGCHTNLGVTLDQTFSFPRKVPGAAGWAYQQIRGIPDVPQLGHKDPEVLTYLRRAGGGDEFRSNAEMLQRWMENGRVKEAEVRRAAPGGDRSIADLLAPSRERALALDKAYRALVEAQTFVQGRDVVLAPATNVHTQIEDEDTGLGDKGLVFTDGQLRLDWRGAGFGM